MRFVAPPRAEVDAARFDHPSFDGFREWRGLLEGEHWPTLEALNAEAEVRGLGARFELQDRACLADGLHYEQRIARGEGIATRADNWHDLLNALVWLRWPQLKRAMNARQVADIERVGPSQRTRGQCALTHFDEAGVILVLRDDVALRHWDEHAWDALFPALGEDDWSLVVVGHALLEHALEAGRLLVGKALAVIDPQLDIEAAAQQVAAGIAGGHLLQDPQELRPLPLMGLRGWHARGAEPEFCRQAPCFQPKRAGRHYPPPLVAGNGCRAATTAAVTASPSPGDG